MEGKQRQEMTMANTKPEFTPEIPESVMCYIGLHPEMFMDRQQHDADVEHFVRLSKKRPEQWKTKPDRQLGEPGVETDEWKTFIGDMDALAWLVWNARMVIQWSSVDRKPTKCWSDAVESAWLRDELFEMCRERRKAFYAEKEARHDRLDGLVKTGTFGGKPPTKSEKAAERARLKAEKALAEKHSPNNPENSTGGLPSGADRLKAQSEGKVQDEPSKQ